MAYLLNKYFFVKPVHYINLFHNPHAHFYMYYIYTDPAIRERIEHAGIP